jgi:hypothetical protein
VLGALLPATEDPAKNLDIFLKVMAMDDGAFGRRFKAARWNSRVSSLSMPKPSLLAGGACGEPIFQSSN